MNEKTARRILESRLSDDNKLRAQALAQRNRRGDLTRDEGVELDRIIRLGTLLSILKVRARRVLKERQDS